MAKRLNAFGIVAEDIPKKVFIDTSVWIYTHGPQADPNDPKSACYSDLFAFLIAAETQIFITPQVLSEIFNVTVKYFRRGHGNIRPKDYRNSNDYKTKLPATLSYIGSVLSTPNLIVYLETNIGDYTNFISDSLDFNDNLYAILSEKEGLTMISDDGDFKECSFDIISANSSVFSSQFI